MGDFYVEFEISNVKSFGKLSEVCEALVAAKSNDDWKDDSYWLAFFDVRAPSDLCE